MIHSTRLPSLISFIVTDINSNSELEKLGAKPEILSIEDATVPQLTSLLKSSKADAVLFAAGAGGKGDPDRTRKVDYEGAVKVYDAMEASNVKRLVLIGAVDIRDRSKGWPEWYDDADSESTIFLTIAIEALMSVEKMSDRMWGAIGKCKHSPSKQYEANDQIAKQNTMLKSNFTREKPSDSQ